MRRFCVPGRRQLFSKVLAAFKRDSDSASAITSSPGFYAKLRLRVVARFSDAPVRRALLHAGRRAKTEPIAMLARTDNTDAPKSGRRSINLPSYLPSGSAGVG
jgi:hypothetical protein